MKVQIVDGNLRHLVEVLDDMRGFEHERCKKMFGEELEKAAAKIQANSLFSYAAIVDGRCVALWGIYVDNLLAEKGYLWMLGTTFLEEHPLAFLRHSRRQLAQLRGVVPHLYGASSVEIDAGSERWMKWLGFAAGPVLDDVRVFTLE